MGRAMKRSHLSLGNDSNVLIRHYPIAYNITQPINDPAKNINSEETQKYPNQFLSHDPRLRDYASIAAPYNP